MAKKVMPKEEEIDVKVSQPNKVESYSTRWFNEHAVNNRRELKQICDLTARSLKDQFNIHLKSGNTEMYAMVFYGTFKAILEFIREQQKRHSELYITIANSVIIGYENNTDEDNEKVGNFMPVMERVGVNRNVIDEVNEDDDDSLLPQNLMKWKQLNIKKNVEYYKIIQEKAYDKLKNEYKTDILTSEAVFPMFCVFLDNISHVVKTKFQELMGTDVSETSINVLGLFEIFYSFNEEDNQEIFEYKPDISTKLALKSDSNALKE